jgi:triphosphoribosyl-dephospho-CoA synthetase
LLRQFGDDLKNPKVSNKWNAPGRALLMDLLSFNRQYISDVSKLDETAKPLYTTESFRDAATVQAMIDQLHARIAVADKYADLEPVLSKMKGYVAAVNGSETEKREYLEGFESTLPNTRASFKALKDKEHAWLQASIDLYQFALSKRGTYAVQNGNLIFKKTGDSDTFNQKLVEARTLRTEYLRTYWEVRHTQEAMAAQMGLKGTEFDPNRPR